MREWVLMRKWLMLAVRIRAEELLPRRARTIRIHSRLRCLRRRRCVVQSPGTVIIPDSRPSAEVARRGGARGGKVFVLCTDLEPA